jgi:hypothetical protein
MRVEIYKPVGGERKGRLCLWYGKSGVGKTATALQTLEDPIFYLQGEGRSIDDTIKAINRPDIKLKVGYYENWNDLLEIMFNPDNFKKCKSFLGDSLTHLMNIHLADEILEENYDARDRKNKDEESMKALTTRVKGTIEMYGVLSKQMSRLMKASENLCIAGIDVHWTARDQESPKWDRALAAAPALAGKEFPRDMKGFFDFIGLVESRIIDGVVVYPPAVSCDDDGSYLSKWTGVKAEGGVIRKPFNIQKMLAVARGEKGGPTS